MSQYLYKELKEQIFEKYSRNGKKEDTGSPESQIALFSYRINSLTEHLKKNRKDKSTQLGLQRLVGKRRKLLDYLKNKDIERYRAVLKELNLRR